jgi:hypothetical protein
MMDSYGQAAHGQAANGQAANGQQAKWTTAISGTTRKDKEH